ncbi:MAG: collagen-like protein [Nocardioides sp.]
MVLKVLRWVGLAAFCAVFGFAGSFVCVKVLADDLQGEQGPAGLPGLVGPQGETGLQGEAGAPADVTSLESKVALVRTSLNKLTPRVKDLEAKVNAPPSTTYCTAGTAIDVITSAQLTRAGDNVSLSTSKASLTPCQ